MELIQFDAPPPDTGAAGDLEMSAERDARLLEAGDYPDKGLAITEDDLDALIARFGEDVPVKVEHADSPLDPVGLVRRLWRDGATLFGRLAFPPDLAAFLKRRGIQKLSVGLSRDPLALREVSLTLRPRIASAALLSRSGDPKDAEITRLRQELRERIVSGQLARFQVEGRVTPAGAPFARALLSVAEEETVTLSEGGEEKSIAAVFSRFLAAQPPVIPFGETVPSGPATSAGRFTAEEEAFLRNSLGVSPDAVARHAPLFTPGKETSQ